MRRVDVDRMRRYRQRTSDRLAWWLMGCPFTGWRGPDDVIPWDYRLGMLLHS